MTCRVFILDCNNQWLTGFIYDLRLLGWTTQFALNLEDFKHRFVESETDVLILRGIDDLATLEYLESIWGVGPSCGLIWMYSTRERFNSKYFWLADNRVALETSNVELVAIVQSLFRYLKRWGWR
jgi:hypothetical protein